MPAIGQVMAQYTSMPLWGYYLIIVPNIILPSIFFKISISNNIDPEIYLKIIKKQVFTISMAKSTNP